MDIENSPTGILSEDDAVAAIQMNRESDNSEDTDQAAPDAEVKDEAEEVEADEVDTDEADDEGEAQDDDETEDTAEDGDTDEDIDADELERGYLRQSDYTRKTQELAADKAALAQERQALTAQAQQGIEQLKQALEFYAVPTQVEPNWVELAGKLEPKQFQQKQAEWRVSQQKAEQAKQLGEQMAASQMNTQRTAETQKLMEKLPEWQDPSIQKRDVEQMVAAGAEFGFSEADIIGIADHRMLLALHKMAKTRSAETVVTRKKAKAPRRVKAGSAPVREDKTAKVLREATARAEASGSAEDAAEVIRLKRQARG